VAEGLALKRDVATSYSREALDGFLDSKVAEVTYQNGISLKQDKEGSYTSNEVDGLFGREGGGDHVPVWSLIKTG